MLGTCKSVSYKCFILQDLKSVCLCRSLCMRYVDARFLILEECPRRQFMSDLYMHTLYLLWTESSGAVS